MSMKHRAVDAPDETGYVPSESPPPVGVRAKKRPRSVRGASQQRAERTSQRSREETPGVLMRMWMGTKLLSGILVVLGAAVALAWGLQRYALTTPRFAIQKLDVTGTLRRSPDQLTKQA
ncbi:MAG: hypothetical protein KC766_24285, partial [Myxococcales bacterium]|nr:hypothetical protein [Myxococcales bacterium]